MARPQSALEAWDALLAGNKNFMSDKPTHPVQTAELRHDIALEQHPYAAIFCCSDSRLGAEMIFDVELGDIFVVRNAGQVIAGTILGSLEFAVEVLEVPLIVVLGHDQCGAIAAAIEVADGKPSHRGQHIENLVSRILPSIHKGRAQGERTTEQFSDRHVVQNLEELLERSEIIANSVSAGKLALVGANYRLEKGQVVLIAKKGSL
jgi:carbonic anhydrase